MGEGRHRAAAAVGGQAGDRGPFEQERQQLGLREDARHQLAVLEVVARQRRLVLGEAAVDLRHPLVGVVDRLALPQQRLRHVLQAERGEVPGRRTQRLDAVDDQPPGGLGEEVAVAAAMFAPAHLVAAAPQAQRHLQALGVIAQHAQVELHQVPADDGIGVMARQPVVEPLQQLGAAGAVLQVEVQPARVAIGRAEHVHLALAAAFQADAVEVAAAVGLDVEGYQAQARAIVRRGAELGIQQQTVVSRRATEGHRRGDEALHQETLGRTDVGLVDIHARGPQGLFQTQQLAVLTTVEPEHRAVMEIAKSKFAQLGILLAAQQLIGALALFGRHEGHRRLHGNPHATGAVIGSQPELDLGARRRVAPVPRQHETQLPFHADDLEKMPTGEFYVLGGGAANRRVCRCQPRWLVHCRP
ncbi:hypothetical protein D3C78_973340 [compost metagenome]